MHYDEQGCSSVVGAGSAGTANRHRYYDPSTASFLTQDPIKLKGGINNYQYVPNPISWVDPLGLSCKEGLMQTKFTAFFNTPVNPETDILPTVGTFDTGFAPLNYVAAMAGSVYNVGATGVNGLMNGLSLPMQGYAAATDQTLEQAENQLMATAASTGPMAPILMTSAKAVSAPAQLSRGVRGTSKTTKSLINTSSSINKKKVLASDFYLSQGWHPKRAESHVNAIDFSKPVEVVTLKKGQPLAQYQASGRGVGNYFAPVGTKPGELGINPTGRKTLIYAPTEDVKVLKSTAAPVVDTWSIPSKPYKAQGGGTQFFTGDPDKFRVISNDE